jgi:hypothetical protein
VTIYINIISVMFDQEAEDQHRRRRPVCLFLLIAMIIILPIESIV